MMKCSLYMSMTDRVTLAKIRVLEYKNAFWYPPEVVGGWKVHTTLMIAWLVTLPLPLPLVFQFHSQSAQTALDVWHCLRLGPFREDADCLKIPCRGRGRCVHTTRGFVCQCEAGFTGDTCEGCLSAAVFIHVIDNVSSLFHQHRCGLLLQMSHVPWCVCVLDALQNGWTDRNDLSHRADSCTWSKEPCIDGLRIGATWRKRLNDRTRRRCGLMSNYLISCLRLCLDKINVFEAKDKL